MSENTVVALEPATPADAALLANLVQLYLHDMSEVFPEIELGADGRCDYPLDRYWQAPERYFPFLLRCEGRLAGFAFAQRGSPMSDEPDVLDVAEFFVLRRYRRARVGRAAALALFRAMPGRWLVRCALNNRTALPFWRSVTSEVALGAVVETERPGKTQKFCVFAFEVR